MTEPVQGGAPQTGPGEPYTEDALPPPPHGGQWSVGARVAVAGTIAAVAVAVVVHLGFVFLHVAPSNTVSKENSDTIGDYVYPEFEQNWKLFAPNPLGLNIAVHVRAEVKRPDGSRAMTGWVSLTAMDIDAIRHNPAPSHVDQNMLRRAFEVYTNSHDDKGKAYGERGLLYEEYLRRIAAHTLGPELNGGRVDRVQLRSVTTPVPAPEWSEDTEDTSPTTKELPWWSVSDKDFS